MSKRKLQLLIEVFDDGNVTTKIEVDELEFAHMIMLGVLEHAKRVVMADVDKHKVPKGEL